MRRLDIGDLVTGCNTVNEEITGLGIRPVNTDSLSQPHRSMARDYQVRQFLRQYDEEIDNE